MGDTLNALQAANHSASVLAGIANPQLVSLLQALNRAWAGVASNVCPGVKPQPTCAKSPPVHRQPLKLFVLPGRAEHDAEVDRSAHRRVARAVRMQLVAWPS